MKTINQQIGSSLATTPQILEYTHNGMCIHKDNHKKEKQKKNKEKKKKEKKK
jgi:hypothetical protein